MTINSLYGIKPISEDQIIDRLQFENPWWAIGSLDAYYKTFNH